MRALIRAVLIAGALLIAGCGMNSGSAETALSASAEQPLSDLSGCISSDEAVLIDHQGEQTQAGVAISGDGPSGVVISYEQGGSVCNWLLLRDRLVDSGYRVLQYERDDGPEDAFVPEMVKLLRAEGVSDVMLIGGSIGGMVSITAATEIEPPVAGVISLSGASTDTTRAAPDLSVPLLQIVAESDSPFAGQAKQTDEAAAGSLDHQLVVVPGTSHASAMLATDRIVVFEKVDAFLRAHLPA